MNLSAEALELLANSEPLLFEKIVRSSGLKIEGKINNDPLKKQSEAGSINSIASMLTEDVNNFVETDQATSIVQKVAEKKGYIISIIEN